MESTRSYAGIADVRQLQGALEAVLGHHDLFVRSVPDPKGFIVRGRKEGIERELTGSAYSLSVTARVSEAGTTVSVSEELLGKAAVGLVLGIFTGGFGALLPGWFAYQQHRIADELWEAVDDHMAIVGASATT